MKIGCSSERQSLKSPPTQGGARPKASAANSRERTSSADLPRALAGRQAEVEVEDLEPAAAPAGVLRTAIVVCWQPRRSQEADRQVDVALRAGSGSG